MTMLDAGALRLLGETHEVGIRTDKHPGTAVVIWVVVADGSVFVRSFRGARGDAGIVISRPAGRQHWKSRANDWRCRPRR